MSERNTSDPIRHLYPGFLGPVVVGLLCTAGVVRGEDQTKDKAGVRVAQFLGPAGTLLCRSSSGLSWQVAAPQAELLSEDLLLALPLARANLASKNGAVQLLFLGNLPGSPLSPIMESAVTLHAPATADLEFTLKRGRLILSNHQTKGPAQVRVRLRGEVWDLTLAEPGNQVALESFGRWPRGVPFSTEPGVTDSPTQDVVLLVLRGSVQLKARGQEFALNAPPGPAYFHWDSVAGDDPAPQRRDGPPSWLDKETLNTPAAKAASLVWSLVVDRCRASKHPEEAVKSLIREAEKLKDPQKASILRAALITLGALDLLDNLTEALGNSSQEMRDEAVVVLRHWIGRGPGQDQKLYEFLQKRMEYSTAHAGIALQLLHSYGTDDLKRPETYETLIAYLGHPRSSIRELAIWHLRRLVPAGKAIPYDPTGSAEARERAQAAWKKLLPPGRLPSG